VVLASDNEKTFLAGLDLKNAMGSDSDNSEGDNPIAQESARLQACFQKFAEMPKPVIAAINGYALGGGCELAVACDCCMMAAGRSGLTELSLGLIAGVGGTYRLTKFLGLAKATELILKAKRLDSAEAADIVLVNEQTEAENLGSAVTAFAEELAAGAVQAMGIAKKAMNAADQPLQEGLDVEAHAFAETFNTEEPGIGLAAFFQKE